MKKQLLNRVVKSLFTIMMGIITSNLMAQTANQIELTGTSSTLDATYNLATVVDPNLVITANGTITGFRVQISGSYSSGDLLSYTGTLPTGITQAFNATTGVLSFTGTTTAENWQTLLRTVTFKSTSSVCYPTSRMITFTAGTVYYNPLTGHFYEYVTLSPAQAWSAAKSQSELRSYFGRIGYLATFSSSAENNFVWKIMSNDGWFGASDDYSVINTAAGNNYYASQAGTTPASENKWTWVSGPESGTQFSNGATAVTGQYANWNGGEPNNSGGEHYGQFYSGSQGRWNDLRSTHTLGGYLCEYGGMAGDNTDYTPYVSRNLTVSGSSTGTISGGGMNVCTGSNSTVLTLSNFTGTVVKWQYSYDNFFTNGVDITNTNLSYTVTNITQTTYYRAVVNSTSPNVCNGQVTASTPVYVTPTIAGNITAINNQICAGGDVELTLSGNQGNINKWQKSINSGTTWTDIVNTTSFHTETLSSAGTYLFRAEVQTPGCGAAVNTSNKTITVISGTPPDGGAVSTSEFCGGTNTGTLMLSGQSGTIDKWQQSTDGGVAWTDIASTAGATSYTFSGVSANRYYRVKVSNASCGFSYSTEGAVLVYSASVAGTVSGAQNICGGFPISNISLSGNTGTIQWQTSSNNSTFTNISGATSNPLTQSVFAPLNANTYIRVAVTNGACATANSNAVLVSVEIPDTLYQDTDGDGFGNPAVDTASCEAVSGYVANDLDCNDGVIYYLDADGDGFGSSTLSGCSGILTSNDCDDTDAAINVSAIEVCNGADDDCDGSVDEGVLITYYTDADNDGYGTTSPTTQACTAPLGYSANNTDCNDNVSGTNPGATEICNGIDDDCEGSVDNGLTFTDYFGDGDGDGYGAGAASNLCSNPGAGYAINDTDCNDTDNNINPGANEICNYIDDNCIDGVDENVTTTYYEDLDGDAYGNAAVTIQECGLLVGYAEVSGDCDDSNANVNPSEAEICNDVDDDCANGIDDGLTFVDYYYDGDQDSYGSLTAPGVGMSGSLATGLQYYLPMDGDFNDASGSNAVVNNGGGVGFTTDRFGQVSKAGDFQTNQRLASTLDVSETAFAVSFFFKTNNPDAGFFAVTGGGNDRHVHLNGGNIRVRLWANESLETSGLNLADNQWHHVVYQYQQDVEVQKVYVDGVVVLSGTRTFSDFNWQDGIYVGYSEDIGYLNGGSMDDVAIWTRVLTLPEIQTLYTSTNVAGDYPVNACADPGVYYVTDSTDCDDSNANVNPSETEICNTIDDDCDEEIDEFVTTTFYLDADNDGFGDPGVSLQACSAPLNYVANNDDCDDDAVTYLDNDGDGFGSTTEVACGEYNNTDCNDNNATLNSISAEVCNNFDDDCDGSVDNGLTFIDYFVDNDGDGYGAGAASNLCSNPGAGYVTNNTDCNDNNATLNSISAEVCNNFDDDCDGSVDDGLTFVNYYVDNDGDGYGVGAASNLCSNPGAGYVTNNTDCNDNNATLNSISAEVCNNFDDDCDGSVDDGLTFVNYYVDNDGDGYGAGAASNLCSNPGAGYVTNNTDCNDNNATLNSISAEVCNNFDDDCDGSVDDGLTFVNYYADNDGDGYGAGAASNLCSNPGAGYVTNNTDCNDNNAALNSISAEVCNNFDDDCDGSVDDGLTFVNYYVDNDGDGYGAGAASNLCSNPGAGYVTNNTDCNDNNATLNSISAEVCNNFDDDCDGSVDDGLTFVNYYADNDGDGYGAGAASNLCSNPGAGYVTNNTDCNDNNATLNSISAEVCNNFDDDCDGSVDDGLTFVNYYVDNDGDGYGAGTASNLCSNPGAGYVTNNTDCNDNNATLNSISAEVCNNFDDDCDGSVDDGLTFVNYYADNDGDGYGAGAASNLCSNPGAGYVTNNTDCDNGASTTYPGATELCNGIDDDCDANVDDNIVFVDYFVDADGDGYGAGVATNSCSNPGAGYVTNNTDCNDNNATLNSISTEVCNNFDDDCDGSVDDGLTFVNYYVDNDGDGYGSGTASNLCSNPGAGYVTNNTDCNDNDATLNSISAEVCNNFDDDCNGSADDGLTFINYYVDNDGDGYGAGAASNLCSDPGAGYVTNDTDCNDNDATLNSISAEVCNNFDDDCNGSADDGLTFINYYVDNDGDGYGAGAASNLCSDPGAGYVTNDTDCNDNDATLNSISAEVCNNFDDDCNGSADDGLTFIDYYVDNDGDGYGAGSASNLCADPGAGYSTNDTDCNDNDATLNSITTEVCNNFDDDCDGSVDNGLTFINYYVDNDGDGYGTGAATNLCADPGVGFATNDSDCDDAVATTYPGASEACNDVDDDCNGVVDNDIVFTDYFADNDGDGYGAGIATSSCSDLGAGYVTDNTDCNDTDNNIYPTAVEVCNYIDDNCDTNTDEGVTTTYYEDADGDGYGNTSNTIQECGLLVGYSENGLDCNDADANINPEAIEVCNTIDDDCDGETDEFVTTTFFADNDGDGFGDASNTADACEQPAGFVANAEDCDDATLTYEDVDGDGYGNSNITACGVLTADDCDDAVATTYPGATEACNDVDDDCNGVVDNDIVFTDYFADSDGDGYGAGIATSSCSDLGAGYVTDNTDCNDADNNIYPTAVEVCNYIDDNCDTNTDEGVTTTYYEDADGDGYGNTSNTIQECGLLVGYSENGLDCNDADANINPEAIEVCNTIDDDCDGEIDEFVTTTFFADNDGDGFGDASNTADACEQPNGFVANAEDCDDATLTYEDVDGDGYGNSNITACGVLTSDDCDDVVATTYPGASEACNDVDDDCNGLVDNDIVFTDYFADNDGDGYGAGIATSSCSDLGAGYVTDNTDCNDVAAGIYPGATEVCNATDDDCNGVVDNDIVFTDYFADNDGDGFGAGVAISSCSDLGAGYTLNATDCDDANALSNPNGIEVCGNGIDENCDGVDASCAINGCTDVTACNYDAAANTEDGSCTYPSESYLTCDGLCINDTDADGVCDEIEVAGCTDATACNYDANATDEDGSCIMPIEEVCNSLDDDCDGEVDEFVQFTYYNDVDGDGFGNVEDVTFACTLPAGYVSNADDCDDSQFMYLDVDGDGYGVAEWVACGALVNGDCDDNNGQVYPSNTETCNLVDDNCDSNVDEGVQNVYYFDNDGDGFGWATNIVLACTAPTGYVSNAEDCDDTLITYQDLDGDGFGSVVMVACGVTDNTDCNDNQLSYADNDGDGFGAGALVACGLADNTDCDDANASANTAMTEVCNEVDDNCDGVVDEGVENTYYADNDGDGFGDVNNVDQACSQPIGFVVNADDCNDNALTYLDADGDGFGVGSPIACGALNNTDCSDNNNAVYPGAIEVCNGLDDNCSGTTDEGLLITFFQDTDADGFGNPEVFVDACSQPVGFVLNDTDCNDALSTANPSGTEVCNGIDEDCDGLVDEGVLIIYYADADGDGYGNALDTTLACQDVDGYVLDNTDCNDDNSTAFPDAQEINDNIDNDCDGLVDEGFEFIPDAFSPNGDGDYDLFELQDLLPNEVVTIQVFNRWGGLVYESENYQNDWDGKGNVGASSGEHLAVGTYFYIIHLNVAQLEKNGYITLWR